jgi:hypothetical protein
MRRSAFLARLAAMAGLGLAAAVGLAGCGGGGATSDGGADATVPSDDGGSGEGPSTLCDEFTEAGAPCPGVSALRCFPLCDAGGCYCRLTPGGGGPRWVCVNDTTCLPDCAPVDPECGAAGD